MKRNPSVNFPVALLIGFRVLMAPMDAVGDDLDKKRIHLNLSLLLQNWIALTEDGSPNGDNMDVDLYMRRIRIIMSGRLNRFRLFLQTDNPDFGKGGDFSQHTFIQDAWMELNLSSALQIDMGMLLVPFSHHGMQGAATLHSLDYHRAMIKYPSDSHKNWRDFGIMFRGLLFSTKFEYRLAILNGAHGSDADLRNPDDYPRVTGRLNFNVFDAESGPGSQGFFLDGIYLNKTEIGVVSTKKFLSFGLSFDWQKDLNIQLKDMSEDLSPDNLKSREDYWAVAADVFFDLPLSFDKRFGLCGQINSYLYYHGTRSESYYQKQDSPDEYSGYGLMLEIGLRYNAFETFVALDWFDAASSNGDLLAINAGFIYWWLAHSVNFKCQFGATREGPSSEFNRSVTFQSQLMF